MATEVIAPAPAAPSVAQAPPDAPAPRRGAARRRFRVVAWQLTVPGLLAVAFVTFVTFGSYVSAEREQHLLHATFRESLAQAVAPVGGKLHLGEPVALLRIPRLGLDQVVVAGSSSHETTKGPGLLPASSLPGQQGASVIVGRRVTFGAPFRHLDDLQPGDRITATTGQGTFTYVVDVVRHSDDSPSQVAVVPSRLTLVTSDPAYAPNRTLVVSAALYAKQPTSRSTVPITRTTDNPGKGDHDGAIVLLLWSQLLVLLSVAATWAAVRLSRRAVWIGAVPLLLAVLWHVFESLSVLLPNTL